MWENTLKTSILFAALTAILVAIGYVIGGNSGMILFLGISIVMNLAALWFSDRIALGMAQAEPLSRQEAPGLYADAEMLASRMGIPTPELYISPQPQPNAFATGRNPRNGVVCFTVGLLNSLDRAEVRGVLAHEMAHIKHRDVLTGTIAAVMAGTVTSLANIGLWMGGGDDEQDRNPLAAIVLVIVAPIAAALVQFAISRTREYAADAVAARFTGEPRALANALVKIESVAQQSSMQINHGLAALFIANPFSGQALFNLFSTHPPIANRIERLLELEK